MKPAVGKGELTRCIGVQELRCRSGPLREAVEVLVAPRGHTVQPGIGGPVLHAHVAEATAG